jgi:tetratricopeptide (TPR) repeat protein
MEALFDPSWDGSAEVGLELNGGDRPGYVFALRALPPADPEGGPGKSDSGSFRLARAGGGRVELRLSQGGVALQSRTLAGTAVAAGTLRLLGTREGSRFTLQVNDLEPLRFEDLFAAAGKDPGRFGVLWPEGVRIVRLRVERMNSPGKASPLEQADRLYAEGKPSEALALYQAQLLTAAAGTWGQEARYKVGLCLVELNRLEEAAGGFEKLAAESVGRWPLLAAVQLWAVRVRQDRMADADLVLDTLAAQYRFDQLVGLVPDAIRSRLLERYRRTLGTLFGLKMTPAERIRIAERFTAAEKLLNGTSREGRYRLIEAHALAGKPDRALVLSEELIREFPTDLGCFGQQIGLLRYRGRTDQALALLHDPPAARADPTGWGWAFVVALLRAGCHGDRKDWTAVESDLSPYLTRTGPDPFLDREVGRAWMMMGFLREERGEEAGARTAWTEALKHFDLEWHHRTNFGLLEFLVARSLGGVSDEQDVEMIFQRVNAAQQGSGLALVRLVPPATVVPVLREVWRSKRGKEWARKIVFQSILPAERAGIPNKLAGYEYIRQHALAGSDDSEQLDIGWEMVDRLADVAFRDGKLSSGQQLAGGMAWKGITSFPGVAGFIDGLPPDLRAPTAYVLGHRMIRLGKVKEADGYFGQALRYAPAGSALLRIAKIDRDLLSAGKGRVTVRNEVPGKVVVEVLRGEAVVAAPEVEGGREIDLEPGDYRVRVKGGTGAVAAARGEVSVAVAGRVHVMLQERKRTAPK